MPKCKVGVGSSRPNLNSCSDGQDATPQVVHDDKGNTSVSFMEAVDVSRPERVQALLDKAMKQVGL